MKLAGSLAGIASALLLGRASAALTNVNFDDSASIKKAASTVAWGMVHYYTGNNTGDVAGNLPSPYYWWEAGAMFGALIDYWYYTGDTTYNTITTQAMLHQVGDDKNYMPINQTRTLGNDDQAFWGMAAMSAAEVNFPNPPADQPQWLALAQAVFNTQAYRWDSQYCGGGLRWQIFQFNNGWNYKNTISNGCFFNIAARLYRYTGNQTYADWAEKAWDWLGTIGLRDDNYHFYDGTDVQINCTQLNHIQWTYNAGVCLLGSATMWNVTQSDVWRNRTEMIMKATDVFFMNGTVMYEVACEGNGKCDVDQRSFKAYLARWMAATTKVAPWTADYLLPLLKSSAVAAVKTCTGGSDGNQCGLKWTDGVFDGSMGVGEQMSVLEVLQSNLITQVGGPLTNQTGGTSQGNPAAGLTGTDSTSLKLDEVTTGDKVGAGFLTTFVLVSILGGAWWMVR